MSDEEQDSSAARDIAGEETVGAWLDDDADRSPQPPQPPAGDLPDEPPAAEPAKSSGGLWQRLRHALGGR
jgi:hypothetical protein